MRDKAVLSRITRHGFWDNYFFGATLTGGNRVVSIMGLLSITMKVKSGIEQGFGGDSETGQ